MKQSNLELYKKLSSTIIHFIDEMDDKTFSELYQGPTKEQVKKDITEREVTEEELNLLKEEFISILKIR